MSDRFSEFRQIVERLRAEDGCPWDRAQTCESLKPCLINEATEAVAAINILNETGDGDNLCEELGDVLLLVMLLSRIAEEEGRFSIEDVLSGVSEKMIRRHPHVFGEGQISESGQVPVKWEEIKKQEKAGKKEGSRAREKQACREAAGEVIRHLEKELEQMKRD